MSIISKDGSNCKMTPRMYPRLREWSALVNSMVNPMVLSSTISSMLFFFLEGYGIGTLML